MADPIISFPFLHPALYAGAPLPQLALFDPGLADTPASGGFRPDNLPLPPKEASNAVARLVAFGDGFKDPRGLADFAASGLAGDALDSSMAIRAELARRNDPEAAAAAKKLEEACRAQTLLGLAWRIEEDALELVAIDHRIGGSHARLEKVLGLAAMDDGVDYENCGCGDDAEFDLPAAPSVSQSPELPPWRLVLEAMLYFLPANAVLATTDADIAATWDEFGANLAEPSGTEAASWFPDGAPQGLKAGRAPGFSLTSRTSADANKPWLDAPRTVLFIPEAT